MHNPTNSFSNSRTGTDAVIGVGASRYAANSPLADRLSMSLAAISEIEGASISTGTAFSELTTFHLGGAPAAVVRCVTTETIAAVVGALDKAEVPLLIVGGGSNLVVADDPGEIVAVVLETDTVNMYTSGHGLAATGAVIEAEAGAVWDDVVAMSVSAGFGGLECLSGIPGSAGATPVQNVGAYGVEVAQVLSEVQLYDRANGLIEWVSPDSLELSYRYSNLKFTGRAVVLAVRFNLTVDGLSAPLRYGELARRLGISAEEGAAGQVRRPVADVRREVLKLRNGKGMVLDEEDHDTWSAGSFFTNPIVTVDTVANVRSRVAALLGQEEADGMPSFPAGIGHEGKMKLSAAWLIERAGFAKGFPGQGAPCRLSTKHTLALTNRGHGVPGTGGVGPFQDGEDRKTTTADLVALAQAVRDGVFDVFGVTLIPEPVWVGTAMD